MATNSGIVVYNDEHNLVLDNTYKNFYVSRVIELSNTGTTTGDFNSGECLAVVGGVSSKNIDAYCENTPTGWTCYVKTWQTGLKVYVLSTDVPDTEHGVGLMIFDENGKVIFNSNVNPARVLAFGHTGVDLPVDGNFLYAISIGAPVYEEYYHEWYTVERQYSSRYYPKQTHQVYHPRETKLVWVAEKWHYEYDTSKEPWVMVKVVDEPAHWETVVVHEAYWETVVDREAYTEYTTSWTEYRHWELLTTWSNFKIKDGRITVNQRDGNQRTGFNSEMLGSGSETSTTAYPIGPIIPRGVESYSDYVVNPTSFLLFDVSGC